MQLADKHIIEFQKLFKERFGIEITKDEAYEKGSRLVQLFQIIQKPLSQNTCEASIDDSKNLRK